MSEAQFVSAIYDSQPPQLFCQPAANEYCTPNGMACVIPIRQGGVPPGLPELRIEKSGQLARMCF
jgi:hypothetical protein